MSQNQMSTLPTEVLGTPLKDIVADLTAITVEKLDIQDRSKAFLADLMDKASDGHVSEKQEYWLRFLYAQALGLVDVNAPSAGSDVASISGLGGIVSLLQGAKGSAMKYPKLYLVTHAGRPVQLSLASNIAKCPNTVNVTDNKKYPDNKWYGRIDLQGVYHPRTSFSESEAEDVMALLVQLNSDIQGTLKAVGEVTNKCPLCGEKSFASDSLPHSACQYHWKLTNTV